MRPLVRVQSVVPLKDHKVIITFENSTQKEVDLDPYLHGPIFETIRSDEKAFRSMKVEDGTIAWENGADIDPDADPQEVSKALRAALSDRNDIGVDITAEEVRIAKQGFVTTRVVLSVLTVLSLITSVLGVFSVVYVTVQTRRLEIGMLKAVGITGWQLTGTFAIESLAMTVSATLAGWAIFPSLCPVFSITSRNASSKECSSIFSMAPIRSAKCSIISRDETVKCFFVAFSS